MMLNRLFKEAKQQLNSLNAIIYSNIIYAHCQTGNMARAEDLVREMEGGGIDAPIDLYHTMMDGYINVRNEEKCLVVFERLKECGFVPSVISYGCLINLYTKIGKVSKALEISKTMESCGIRHNSKTYSMLINGFIQLNDYANAFSIFEEMLKAGLKPDLVLYNIIVNAFCKMGNIDRAIRIVDEMQKERHRPSSRTFRPIIYGFAVAGDMKKALEIFDLMRRSSCIPTVETYNVLILGLVRKHQMEKAVEVIDKMILAGIAPTEHTYTTIMEGYASEGDTGKAFEYFTKIKDGGLKLDVFTYEALLKACCKSGRMQSALAVTREMSAQRIPRNTFVYNILIDGWARRGDVWEAADLMQQMKEDGVLPDIHTYTSFVNACCKAGDMLSHGVNSSWSTEDLRRSSPKTKRVDSLPTNANWPSGSSSALASRPRLKVLSRSSGTSHESDHPRNATARSSGDGQDTSMKAKKIVSLKKNILARMPSSPLEAVNDDDEDDTVERIPKTFRKRRSERGGKLASDATGTSKKVRTHRSSFFSSTLSSRIGESMEWMLPSGRNLPESEEEEEEEVVMPMEEPGHSTPEQKPLEAECPDIVFSFSSNAQSFTHEEQASPRLNDKTEMRSFDVQMADKVAFRGEGKLRPVVRTRAETASADHGSSDCLTSHGGIGLDAPLENSSVTSSQAKSDQCRTPAPLDSEPSFSPGSTASIVSTPPQEAYRPEGSEAEPTARPEHTGEARGRAIETRNEKIEMISQAKERPEQVSDGQGCCCSRREGAVPSRGMQISALCIAPPRLSSSFVSYPGLRSGSPTDLTKSSPESGAGKLLPAAYGGLGSNSASSPSQTPPTPNSVLRLMGKDLMVLKEDQSTRPSNPQPAPSENSSPRLGVGPAPTVPEHEGYWYNYRPQLRDGPCVFGQVFPVAIHQFPLHPSSMKRRNTKEEVIVIDDSPDSGPEMADALPTIAVSNPIAQQRQFACFPSRTQYVTRDVSGGFRPVFPRTDTRELANAVRSAEGLRPLLPNPFYFRSTSTGQHHGQPVYYP